MAAAPNHPFHYIPPTISEQAQEFLRTQVPTEEPTGIEPINLDWSQYRHDYCEATLKSSNIAKDRFVENSNESQIGDIPVTIITPKDYEGLNEKKILIYIHGGGYALGATNHLYQLFAPVAHSAQLQTYSIDYRLAPENPFPVGLNDCVTVYEELLKTYGSENIFMLGDSSGGALVLSTLLKARDEKRLPMPAAIGLFSPWTEAQKKGDSYFTLEDRSPVLQYETNLHSSMTVYAGETSLENPYISPIYGDFSGFPSTKITTGTRDYFLSNCSRLYEKMEEQGVDVQISIREGMWHNYQDNIDLPEAQKSHRAMAKFFKAHM